MAGKPLEQVQTINWQAVVNERGPMVWRTAYKLLGNHTEASECFQETFLAAFRYTQQRRARNMGALLASIATSKAIDQLRRRYNTRQRTVDTVDITVLPSEDPGPQEDLHSHELAERLRRAIAQLPEREAQALSLRCFNGLSYRRIARQLDTTTGTVSSLISRGRTKLKQKLTGQGKSQEARKNESQ